MRNVPLTFKHVESLRTNTLVAFGKKSNIQAGRYRTLSWTLPSGYFTPEVCPARSFQSGPRLTTRPDSKRSMARTESVCSVVVEFNRP